VGDTTVDHGPPTGKSSLAAASVTTTAEAVDKCVVMVVVVAIWALTISGGANEYSEYDRRTLGIDLRSPVWD